MAHCPVAYRCQNSGCTTNVVVMITGNKTGAVSQGLVVVTEKPAVSSTPNVMGMVMGQDMGTQTQQLAVYRAD